ncbi:hypothetical protein HMI54_010657 [Coelomomyces lativittatus]|nr:hypothetical protein HMI55_000486 [Coelomomyces lativittatus]KAJ1514839.1 hypothetical protein HMI56_007282 [Coelomomyces lativittatus]KAJ1516166.1 hypothetical protein HMI54_010657 [Coelomomyces lativittatus]
MFNQPVYQLKVSKDLQRRLWHAGFQCTNDLKDASIEDLVLEAKLLPNEADQVLSSLNNIAPNLNLSLSHSIETKSNLEPLLFGSDILDSMLSSLDCVGLLPGKIYEFTSVVTFGIPQLIRNFVEKYSEKTIFVDTMGHMSSAKKQYHLVSAVEVLAWIHLFPSIKDPTDRILIIDSILCPFENGYIHRIEDALVMLRNYMGSTTVILTSHFDANLPHHSGNPYIPITKWAHCVDVHVSCYWKKDQRAISLLKGFKKPMTTLVDIDEKGNLKEILE